MGKGKSVHGEEDPRRDAEEEIRFHLEERVRALMARGMNEDDARAEALRRFGNPDAVREDVVREDLRAHRRRRMRGLLDTIRQDVVYALRRLRSAPAFSLVAVLTVGLTLGATTAIFSVVDGILLRPLPFPESDRLVAVWADHTGQSGPEREWHSYQNLHDLREEARTLQSLGWYLGSSSTLTGDGDQPEQVASSRVDRALLQDVLQVAPAAGRLFLAEEDTPGGPGAVLLSHDLWRGRFGGDPGILGRSILIDDRPTPVVGILPETFQPPFATDARLWLPLQHSATDAIGSRGAAVYRAIGRLGEGVPLETARLELREIGSRLETTYPQSNTGVTFAVFPLLEDLTAGPRTGLVVLLGAVGMVLLVGCVNVAILLLSRASGRRGEMAVRSALGGGGRRLLGQVLTENLVLAALGGLVGIALAFGGTAILAGLAPPGIPRAENIAVNGRVLAFAALATLGCGLLFGLLPALRSAAAPAGALREEGRSGQGSRDGSRLRSGLVVLQVAMALVLLMGSGLLLRSFNNLRQAELGFQPEGVLTFQLSLPQARYPDGDALRAMHTDLLSRLEQIPGVDAVGITSTLPLGGGATDMSFRIEGREPPAAGEGPVTWYRQVSSGYFPALGIQPLQGRMLDERDREGPPALVVNETFAARWFPGEDVLGRRLNTGSSDTPTWWEIVGVVSDQRGYGLRPDGIRSEVLLPLARVPSGFFSVTLRTPGDPDALGPAVREAVAGVDASLPVSTLRPMTEVVDEALAEDRFVAFLLTLFASVALLLAAVGLYGVVSFGVSSRRREMGVRMALGAPARSVGTLVLVGSLWMVAAGVVLGGAGALALTRVLQGMLVGVEAADPSTFIAVAAVLASVAAVAAVIPAVRAARTDPVDALRAD